MTGPREESANRIGCAQKNAPTTGNAAEANAAEAASLDEGRTDYHLAVEPGHDSFSKPPAAHESKVSTLAAQFALVGRELHVITKAHGRTHFEVSHWSGECYTCSTAADLQGLLARTGGAHA